MIGLYDYVECRLGAYVLHDAARHGCDCDDVNRIKIRLKIQRRVMLFLYPGSSVTIAFQVLICDVAPRETEAMVSEAITHAATYVV